jgi:D-sedoheptulose 7-phosphate isomerase
MLNEALFELRETAEASHSLEAGVERASTLMVEVLAAGGKVLACGNGGSAAEAQHFVTELVGRYRSNRRALPAIWLGGDTGQMSCIANDFSPAEVFSRPLQAVANHGDVLLVLSSSGRSPNIIRCLEEANRNGIQSIALLGKGGGTAAEMASISVVVPSFSTARVQEIHLLIIHALCEAIETHFPAT